MTWEWYLPETLIDLELANSSADKFLFDNS
jgi:hypothetical protein